MKLEFPLLLFALLSDPSSAFTRNVPNVRSVASQLSVSIGLGPEEKVGDENEMVAGVDYEVPDHESFRTSRRSKIDEQADAWFESLLGGEDDKGILGSLADDARKTLLAKVPLVNDEPKPMDDEEWTPYVNTKLPWTPLTPAYGLEQFGLPIPRRNAEMWRHFDVMGMINQNYSASPENTGTNVELTEEEVLVTKEKLSSVGGWLEDEACQARLVYINGRFVPQLSKTNDMAQNLENLDSVADDVKDLLARLTDGFTDKLACPVPIGDDMYWDSFKKLSLPDHCIGEATSQFAINTQQGTACFAALNTIKTGAVAFVRVPDGHDEGEEGTKPIIVVNAVTQNGGAPEGSDGVAFHPRCLVMAGDNSNLSFVQTTVDLDDGSDPVPTLHNGYTQIFVGGGANVTHSFLEESGGMVTPSVELSDDDFDEGVEVPRAIESKRPALKDTHLDAVDVHVIGEEGSYEGTLMSVGGSGRVRLAHSVALLQPAAHAKINGFSLSGGAQRTDCRTNIHHIAQGTTSEQIQKNMIGGRATGSFRGRIRVEQSAQQTDSQQLSRTVLLSDRSRAWACPTLEIIADDVQCTHGATVSDLSEEELFYLRSRGLDRTLSRNLLMYAFADDVSSCVEPAMQKSIDSDKGLQKRLIERMQNVVPRGDRAVKGEFQSV